LGKDQQSRDPRQGRRNLDEKSGVNTDLPRLD
jgi:hypothetical protein